MAAGRPPHPRHPPPACSRAPATCCATPPPRRPQTRGLRWRCCRGGSTLTRCCPSTRGWTGGTSAPGAATSGAAARQLPRGFHAAPGLPCRRRRRRRCPAGPIGQLVWAVRCRCPSFAVPRKGLWRGGISWAGRRPARPQQSVAAASRKGRLAALPLPLLAPVRPPPAARPPPPPAPPAPLQGAPRRRVELRRRLHLSL
jgi:hypothetical protein